eukprot:CAMPEP_0117059884 /NCGR_PEP_ID=MMETSP0472-20121206/41628_1 /TAXON_ID=693140 ORGANISM="Tiarina fusus, Strain LIS" /NCGR_SAMPLE_ID=MMETSP0472 /ASSEMBLY_ACC=CAM_ASM_000603 /LENGTH=182 /DNA_ID=CAMNT_0004777827 /DNA_START=96 /DNA_END=641 /DNA_ORIENTATION=-
METCRDVRSSVALHTCLQVLLTLGNDYFGNTSRGFYPDSLFCIPVACGPDERLIVERAVDILAPDPTFPIDYLPIEIPQLSSASVIDLTAVYHDIQRLVSSESKMQQYSSLFEKQNFLELEKESVRKEAITNLEVKCKEAQKMYKEIVLYFTADEDYASILPSHLFFGSFNSFVKSLQSKMG